jgi:hypothetical protein
MIPPELTVTPEDQQNISAINNVTYNIKGFGNEDLKSFKLYTTPYFYKFDTTFGTFVHSLNFEITLQLPEILQDLPDDSIITVTFELADSYDKTTVIRTLKVIDGYTPIFEGSGKLVYQRDTAIFFSFENEMPLKFDQITDRNFDLVFLKDTALGYIFASPTAVFSAYNLVHLGYSYSASNKSQTSLTRFNTNYSDVDKRFIYYLNVADSYIDDNIGNGRGEENLKVNDVIAFKTMNGKKGVLMISDIDSATNTISFDYKYQLDVQKN